MLESLSQVIKDLGEIFGSVVESPLIWIREENVGPGLAFVIVATGALVFAIILYRFCAEYLLLKRARDILQKGASESEFFNNYNDINENLLKVPQIKEAWKEFSETLVPPSQSNDSSKRTYSNTERPHDFFNLHDLHMGPGFTKAIPGIFIAVGLSLTFFGLISALAAAAEGIKVAAGNTESMQVSIGNLLNAASAKFYASLFALFTSILINIEIKASAYFLERALKRLNYAIQCCVRYVSLESVSIQGNEIMRSQLEQLQTFNTDLAMKIGEEVQSSLQKTLDPLIEKITEMGADITESNIQNLTRITEEVTKGIQGAAGESMDRVASTLDAVSDKLGGLTDILSGALSSFDSDFKKMLDGLKTSLEHSTDSVAQGVGKTMADMNDGIQESATTVTGLVNGLAGTIEDLSRSGAEIAAKGGEALSASVSAAAAAAGESITRAGQELSSGFKNSTDDLVNSFTTINQQIIALDKSLSGLPESLSKINDKLAESSQSISDASIQFRAAGGGLQSVIEPLSTFAVETRSIMQELTQALDASSKDVASASGLINDSVEVIRAEVGSQIEQLSGSDEQLATLLGGIETSTERVLQSVATYVTEVDRNFSNSLGVLENTIATLEETLTAQIVGANNDLKS